MSKIRSYKQMPETLDLEWTIFAFFFFLGKTFSKEETFGAFPLQVQGYGDVHDSLEGAMAQVEIEPVGPEGAHKSGQEVLMKESWNR